MRRTFPGFALLATATIVATASCGSRTPLPAPEAVAIDADSGTNIVNVPCVPGRFTLQKASPAIMFVIDRSTSMRESFGNFGQSRWLVLADALAAVLPPLDTSVQMGALFYPTVGARRNTCPVPSAPDVALGFDHARLLVQTMRGTSPNGATPTADALESASKSVLAFRAATSARALVLATDGAPNCNATLDRSNCRCSGPNCATAIQCLDDARTITRIAGYAARGLPTYVIGLQSTGDRDFDDVLDAMAVAGSRPKSGTGRRYYAATSETELTSALLDIREQVASCTYLSTSVPSETGSITVTLDGSTIPFDEARDTGWSWGNKGNGEILLAADVCQKVVGSPRSNLAATVACETTPDASSQ